MPGGPQHRSGTSYWAICAQLIAMSSGSGYCAALTSTLLGSVEKSRSGIAAGVLNAPGKPAACLASLVRFSLVSRSGGLHEQAFTRR